MRAPIRPFVAGCLAFTLATPAPSSRADAGTEATATASAQIRPDGPRQGRSGMQYLTIQGKENGEGGRFATFCVLDFPAAGLDLDKGKVEQMTLTLTQSLTAYARDGKVKFYLTGKLDAVTGPTARPFRFDLGSADGVGDQLDPRVGVGSGTFAKKETGRVDTFTLTIDEAARKLLDAQPRDGGTVRLVIVPDDPNVAATYYGWVTNEPAQKPRLAVGGGEKAP